MTATSKRSLGTAMYSTLIAGSTSINSYATLFSSSLSDRKVFSYIDQLLRNHPKEHSRVNYLRDPALMADSMIFPSIWEMVVIGVVLGFTFYAYNAARIVEVLGSELLNFGSMNITGIGQKLYYGEINQTLTSTPSLLRNLSFLFLSVSFATFFFYNFNHPDVKKPIPLNFLVTLAAKIFVAFLVAHIMFMV